MYKGPTLTGEEMVKTATTGAPLGPGFGADLVNKAVSMEVWHSSFKDEGPDFSEFVLKDEAGAELGRERVQGY